jgi:hypothetical protein
VVLLLFDVFGPFFFELQVNEFKFLLVNGIFLVESRHNAFLLLFGLLELRDEVLDLRFLVRVFRLVLREDLVHLLLLGVTELLVLMSHFLYLVERFLEVLFELVFRIFILLFFKLEFLV